MENHAGLLFSLIPRILQNRVICFKKRHLKRQIMLTIKPNTGIRHFSEQLIFPNGDSVKLT